MKIEGELKELEQAFLKRLFSKSGGHSGSFNSLDMEDYTANIRSRGSSVSYSNGGLRSSGDRGSSSMKKQLGA